MGGQERCQDSPVKSNKAQLIRCVLYGKQEQFNSCDVTGLY